MPSLAKNSRNSRIPISRLSVRRTGAGTQDSCFRGPLMGQFRSVCQSRRWEHRRSAGRVWSTRSCVFVLATLNRSAAKSQPSPFRDADGVVQLW